MRKILQIVKAQKVKMGSIFLDQALPVRGLDQVDPFLLIHHLSEKYAGGEEQKEVGVPPHPHRGFSPVTFVFKGAVNHRDSMGNDKLVSEGGIQWLFAGSGMIHSERPSVDIAKKGGTMEIIQIWVNAPKAKKMEKPFYYPLSKGEIPLVFSSEKKSEIGIICGEVNGVKGPMPTMQPLSIMRGELKAGDDFTFSQPSSFHILIYVLDGKLFCNGKNLDEKSLVSFDTNAEDLHIAALENTRLIILCGEPLNEAVATYGPFVMSTDQELNRAVDDFHNGKMGELEEGF